MKEHGWGGLFLVTGMLAIGGMVFGACSTVPVTGRQQLSLVSSAEMLSMSTQEYKDFLKNNKAVPAGDTRTAMVQHVGRNIQSAVEQYYHQNKIAGR